MAALPGIQARPVNANRPQAESFPVTDFGLGGVAQDIGQFRQERDRTQALQEEVQAERDTETTRPAVEQLRQEVEPALVESAARWDGRSPGFAQAQLAGIDARVAELLADNNYTPGQQAALRRQADNLRATYAQQAITLEDQGRGRVAAEGVAAQRTSRITGAYVGFLRDYGPVLHQLQTAENFTDGGFADRAMNAYDTAAATALENAPDDIREDLRARINGDRGQAYAGYLTVQAHGSDAVLINQATSAGDALVNSITSSPGLFSTAERTITDIVSTLPDANARADMSRSLRSRSAEARVHALIAAGQTDVALSELNGGTLDTWLSGDAKTSLIREATADRQRLTEADYEARLRAQGQIESDIESRALTGRGVSLDRTALARVLSPDQMAEWTVRGERADALHAEMGDFTGLTESQMNARVAAMAPTPGAANFHDQQQAYELAQRRAHEEIESRHRDAAAWAFTARPGLVSQFQAITTAPTQEGRRAAADAYAHGTLQAQTAAGIAVDTRRILAAPAATALAHQVITAQDRTQGLTVLGAMIDAFAAAPGATAEIRANGLARQAMVMRELVAAGLPSGDIAAALDFSGDPVHLGRYLEAQRVPVTNITAAQRRDAGVAAEAALGQFLSSFRPLDRFGTATNARRDLVTTMTVAGMAQGHTATEAARDAARVYNDRYAYGPGGWRMPVSVEQQYNHGQWIVVGSQSTLRGLTGNHAAGFYTPPADAPNMAHLTAEQRREFYAATVTRNGAWVTTPDDAGLILMQRGLDGRMIAALDPAGAPIVRTWRQLAAAAPGSPQQIEASRPRPGPGQGATYDGPTWTPDQALARVRAIVPGVTESSGTRTIAQNRAAHGSATSHHLPQGPNHQGTALDLQPPAGMTHAALYAILQRSGLPHAELLLNDRGPHHPHVHWAWPLGRGPQ